MKAAPFAVVCLSFVLSGQEIATASIRTEVPSIRTVTSLHRNETNRAFAFAAGHLWVGQSQSAGTGDREEKLAGPRLSSGTIPADYFHRVEIYAPGSNVATDTAELIHSPSELYAIDEKTVLAVGKSAHPWETHYTKMSLGPNGKVVTETTTFGGDDAILILGFAQGRDRWFFTAADEDGTVAVPAGAAPKNLERENVTWLPGRLILPGAVEVASDNLVAIEYLDMMRHDDDRVVVVDSETGEKSVLADASGLHHPTHLKAVEGSQVVISESGADRLLYLDAAAKKVTQAIAIEGAPTGIATYGKCVAVTTMFNKTVEFLRPEQGQLKRVLAWDVKGAGNTLSRPTEIAADVQSGSVFLRSNYACPSCFPSMNSVVELRPNSALLAEACLAK